MHLEGNGVSAEGGLQLELDTSSRTAKGRYVTDEPGLGVLDSARLFLWLCSLISF